MNIRLNFEKAVNYIKSRAKTMKADVKKDISSAQISMALPQDRKRYLAYTISCLDEVSPAIMREIPNRETYSRKEAAKLLRHLLILRCSGLSTTRLAHDFKVSEEQVKRLEEVAVIAVKEAIERKKLTGVPILGGK